MIAIPHTQFGLQNQFHLHCYLQHTFHRSFPQGKTILKNVSPPVVQRVKEGFRYDRLQMDELLDMAQAAPIVPY